MKPNPIIIANDEFIELTSKNKTETNTIIIHGDPELSLGSKILVMNESKTNDAQAIITSIVSVESLPTDKHKAYRVQLTKAN